MFGSILGFLSKAKKAVVAGVGVALTALLFAHSLTFLPVAVDNVIGTVIAVLTPIVTWLSPPKVVSS